MRSCLGRAGKHNGALLVSTWCRVCEFRLPRLQSGVAKARCGYRQTEREKARPMLEAAHQSFHPDTKPCEMQWSGLEEGGSSSSSSTIPARNLLPDWPIAWLFFTVFRKRAFLSARTSLWRRVTGSQGSWRRKRNPYATKCCSSPPASLKISTTLQISELQSSLSSEESVLHSPSQHKLFKGKLRLRDYGGNP